MGHFSRQKSATHCTLEVLHAVEIVWAGIVLVCYLQITSLRIDGESAVHMCPLFVMHPLPYNACIRPGSASACINCASNLALCRFIWSLLSLFDCVVSQSVACLHCVFTRSGFASPSRWPRIVGWALPLGPSLLGPSLGPSSGPSLGLLWVPAVPAWAEPHAQTWVG